jgi:hypothetical protein
MVAEQVPSPEHGVLDFDRSPNAQRLDQIISLLTRIANPPKVHKPDSKSMVEIGRNRITPSVRMRATKLVFSLSQADSIVLTLGTRSMTFYDLGTGLQQIEFPRVIESGTDILLTPANGATVVGAAWIEYEPI